jgi:hypothetical protein
MQIHLNRVIIREAIKKYPVKLGKFSQQGGRVVDDKAYIPITIKMLLELKKMFSSVSHLCYGLRVVG